MDARSLPPPGGPSIPTTQTRVCPSCEGEGYVPLDVDYRPDTGRLVIVGGLCVACKGEGARRLPLRGRRCVRVTVEELMDRLSEMPEDAEVRLAHQPGWPFEYRIDAFNPAVVAKDNDNADVVYIAEAGQIGYLPGSVAAELSW